MAGRKLKLTTDSKARPEQRQRTQALITDTKAMQELQKTPPHHLNNVAVRVWRELWPILSKSGLVKQADKAVVSSLCEQVSVEREAYKSIVADGVVLKDGRKNPACQVLDSATAKVKSLSDALGLNPQARASIMNVSDNNDDDDADDIVAQLKHGGDTAW